MDLLYLLYRISVGISNYVWSFFTYSSRDQEKISKKRENAKKYLEENKDTMIHVVIVTKHPFSWVWDHRDALKNYNLLIVCDMSIQGLFMRSTHAASIVGRAKDVARAFDEIDWITEVQKIPSISVT